jgi:hypothetical protein
MDYGQAWRQGERVLTANIEPTVNQLINQRMCNNLLRIQPRPLNRRCAFNGFTPRYTSKTAAGAAKMSDRLKLILPKERSRANLEVQSLMIWEIADGAGSKRQATEFREGFNIVLALS